MKTIIKCVNCTKDTTNPRFCSRTCGAVYNNKAFPKRKRKVRTKIFCEKCGKELSKNGKIRCKSCVNPNLTLAGSKDEFGRFRHNLIRGRSRLLLKDEKECKRCGYDKHIEICHIKPISSFSLDTLVDIVNDRSNLIALCPNCHWEFDHNLVTLEEILAPLA